MISVIVPVLNEASILASSLARIKDLRAAHELIVVDGGSDDGTQEIAAEMLSYSSTRTSGWRPEPWRRSRNPWHMGTWEARSASESRGSDSYSAG